jgi:hypothetical protein
MDGDGTAAGDLPYSIETYPTSSNFYRSCPRYGAFGTTTWHPDEPRLREPRPLTAKHLFFSPIHHAKGFHALWCDSRSPVRGV